MDVSELPKELSDRGVWWQVAGFGMVAVASLGILQEFSGPESRSYQYLETATKDLYWAFVAPLAGLFEGIRKMFEKASEIRAAYRHKIVTNATEKGLRRGRQEGRRQYSDHIREAYERFGVERDGVVTLPRTPEVEQFLFSSDGKPYY